VSLWVLFLGYLVAINFICFVAFGWDKRMAVSGGWRVRESTLLSLALLGGGLGGKAAQKKFRHKTRKEPFRSVLNVMLGLNVACLLALTLSGVLSTPVAGLRDGLSGVWSAPQKQPPRKMPRRFGPGS